jgi:hypothetical protein
MAGMTKGERMELSQLIRKRERVMKSQAQERSALLLAEFDAASAKIYHYDDDPIWQQVHAEAEKAIRDAQAAIAARCKELGIPEEFAPGLNIYWHGRGHNAVSERRAELRRAAKSRIQAIEKEAATKIERMSLEAQTEVVAQGLESDAAKRFLNAMPAMETLMPPIQIAEIQSLVEVQKRERKMRELEWMQ